MTLRRAPIRTGLSLALIALLVGLMQSHLRAADDSKGTDFWLMFNLNYQGTPALSLFITGDTNTTGTVAIPGLGFSAPFSVTANAVTTVVLPAGAQQTGSNNIGNLGIHVTALAEVTVYGLNRIQFTTDAFLGLPTDILGTEYLVMSHETTQGNMGSELGIVATVDDTVVTITPTAAVPTHPANLPYVITLDRGQTYQAKADAFGADLTGTVITSTAPIAVFGAVQCVNIPNGGTFACDHIVEQMPPTSTWGKNFATVPLATRLNGDTFRFLAQTNGTTVEVNGTLVATLNRGQVHERQITGRAVIIASQPILVAQFSNGSSWDGVTSDPFMMLIPPYEQFLADYTITTPASGFANNFVNVVVANSGVGSVTLDGVAIPPAAFAAIPGTNFSGAQRNVALGSHHLTGPVPFGVFAYGFDSFDWYGYPGGLALGEVALVTDLVLAPKVATNPVNTSHCVVATVTDQNGGALAGVRVDFSVSGTHTTSGFIFTDAVGKAEFCYTGTLPGVDSILASVGAGVGSVSDTASKSWVSGAMVCDVDGDKDVDMVDIAAINAARNTVAAPGDPRDANNDGKINVVDSRYCTVRRTATPN